MESKGLTREQIDRIYHKEVDNIDKGHDLVSKVSMVFTGGAPLLGIGYSLHSGEIIYANLGLSAIFLGMAGVLASGFCALARENSLRRDLYGKNSAE